LADSAPDPITILLDNTDENAAATDSKADGKTDRETDRESCQFASTQRNEPRWFYTVKARSERGFVREIARMLP